MKNYTLKFFAAVLAVSFLAAGLSSCKKLLKPKTFNAYGATFEITVPPTNGTSIEATKTVTVNVDSLASAYKFSRKNIDMVTFKEATATIVDSHSNPYSFDIVSAFRGYVKLAGKSDVPVIDDSNIEQNSSSTIKLDVKSNDIKEYLNGNTFDLYINASIRDTIEHEFKIELRIKYDIIARL